MAFHLLGAKPLPEAIVVNWTLKNNNLWWNFIKNSNIFIEENAFEGALCQMAAILSQPQCVNSKQ